MAATNRALRIVLCYPLEDRHLAQIQRAAPNCQLINAGQERIAQELLAADIYCGHAKVPVDWQAVVDLGRLQWIQSSAAGIDHCLTPQVAASPIPVTSAAGLFAPQVAEQTLALLLALVRSLPVFYRAQQRHLFERRPTSDVRGKTVGIIGFGGNGQQIAQVLAAFGPRIVAIDLLPDKRPKPPYLERLFPASDIDKVLPCCDIVVLCVPLTTATRAMFSGPRLGLMKQGSILINVARGEIVKELDLVAALKCGHLSGAGLDVTEQEPLSPESELWNLDNVVITPHVGAQSFDRIDRTTDFFCENLIRFQNGRELRNRVDKSLEF